MEAIIFILYIGVFLFSVILHEVAHGLVAYRFGDDTAKVSGRLSLNPLVHIDPFGSVFLPLLLQISTGFAFGYAKPVPVNPYRLQGGAKAMRWVSLAGIITNLAIALVAATGLSLISRIALDPSNLGVIFLVIIFKLNIILGVFNLLPFPGFDGFNFLSTFSGFLALLRQTPLANPLFSARYGLVVSLILLMLLWNVVGVFLGYVLFFVADSFGIVQVLLAVKAIVPWVF